MINKMVWVAMRLPPLPINLDTVHDQDSVKQQMIGGAKRYN